MPNGLCSADVALFHHFSGPLETKSNQLSQNVLDRSSPIHPTFISRSLRGRCYDNRFLARIGENWHTPCTFIVCADTSQREDRSVDARVNTADDTSTSIQNLVNFGPVTRTFCIRAGYTLGFATSGVTAYRQGWTKSRGPKVLGAPEQCSKKFNMDVSRNSRYVSLN